MKLVLLQILTPDKASRISQQSILQKFFITTRKIASPHFDQPLFIIKPPDDLLLCGTVLQITYLWCISFLEMPLKW